MMNLSRRKAVQRSALLPAAALLVGLAGGTALAYNAAHDGIVLKNAGGTAITKNEDGSATAYSIKNTCFGTAGCHGTGSGNLAYTYDQIERHSYHAQLGANEIRGFNPANPDAYNPYLKNADGTDAANAGDKWRPGAGPQGKNWVQSPGHVGSW